MNACCQHEHIYPGVTIIGIGSEHLHHLTVVIILCSVVCLHWNTEAVVVVVMLPQMPEDDPQQR